jgi:hypothetical protein
MATEMYIVWRKIKIHSRAILIFKPYKEKFSTIKFLQPQRPHSQNLIFLKAKHNPHLIVLGFLKKFLGDFRNMKLISAIHCEKLYGSILQRSVFGFFNGF